MFHLLRSVSDGNKLICCVYPEAARSVSVVELFRSFVRKEVSVSSSIRRATPRLIMCHLLQAHLMHGTLRYISAEHYWLSAFARVMFTCMLYILLFI